MLIFKGNGTRAAKIKLSASTQQRSLLLLWSIILLILATYGVGANTTLPPTDLQRVDSMTSGE